MIKYILAFCLLATSAFAVSSVGGGGSGLNKVNVFSVMDYGAVHNGISDDLPAINSAVAAAYNAGGGDVYLPNGHYMLLGAFNGSTNSLITVPQHTNYAGFVPRVRIIGESRGTTGLDNLSYEGGVVLDATGAPSGSGSYPSVIAGAPFQAITNYTLEPSKWNRVGLNVSNVMIWTPPDSTFGGINLHNSMQGSVGPHVAVVTKSSGGDIALPTHTAAVGIIMPAHLNNVVDVGIESDVSVLGFYDGIWLGEHMTMKRPYIACCVNAIRARFIAHPATGEASIESCKRAIFVDPAATTCPISLTLQGELNTAGKWYDADTSGAIVYDPNNYLRGTLGFEFLSTLVGTFVTTMTYTEQVGGAGLNFFNMMVSAGGTPPASPLIAKYDLSDLTDASGNGRTLTDHNSVTFVAGKVGNAANFNGTTQYLSSTSVHPGAGSFTICAWVYVTSTGCIMAEQGNASLRWAMYEIGGNQFYTEFYDTSSGLVTPTTVTTYPLNTWRFVVMTFNSSTRVCRLQVNQDGWISATLSNPMATAGTPTFTMGGNLNPSGGAFQAPFGGKVDAVRIYNSVLSDADIALIYNSGNGSE